MSKRVLIVDDDPAQRRILEEVIKRLGYQTRTAASGDKALDILLGPDAGTISLVLLDLVMPGMDGYEVCRQLKADPATAAIPVVFLTGESGVDAEVAAAGGCGYTTKPVDPATLLQLIDQHLGGAE